MSQPDVLIVGGGTAGCVLAARLSEDPDRSVVLLEAGRDIRTPDELPPVLVGHPDNTVLAVPDTWRYRVELIESPPRHVGQFRGRILGGSSSINGSLFVRGIPEDYDGWGSPLWDYAHVLPYFRKLETDVDVANEFHGTDGPIVVSRALDVALTRGQERVYAAARRAGYPEKVDLNHPVGGGIGRVPMACSTRSTALSYLARCRDRRNLTVVPGTVATRVVVEGRRAVGVEVVQGGRALESIRAAHVVLSAGTFGSAHLLLASGIGPAEHLRSMDIPCVADRPGVGQNLRCHPMLTLRFADASSDSSDPETPRLGLVHSAGERNNVMVFPKHVPGGLAMMVTLRLPVSSGQVRLQASDSRTPPSISYGYLEPSDRAKLSEGLQVACDLAQRSSSKDLVGLPALSDAWMLQHLETADHACGTCKMGPPDDPLAVVDDTCRVHGIDGLRVVDLSIVPRPVRAGPYPTVIMLAERAADRINASRGEKSD